MNTRRPTPPVSAFASALSARELRPTALLLAALAVLPAGGLRAANLYWDANGTTAGAGATPTGTWGTDNFWNSDSTGGAGGTFTTATTGNDTIYFSAGPNNSTANYTITVNGTQAAAGLQMQNLGALTLSGGTLNLGAGGITIPRNVLTTNDQNSVTISSNIALQTSQTWSSNMAVSGGAFRVTGNVSGSGNLSLSQLSSRLFELSGSVNHTGAIISTGTNSAGVTISGNIGSSVTEVRVTTSAALKLTGNNTYAGNTLIGGSNFTSPVLRVGSNSALPASTSVIMSVGGTSANSTLDLGDGANSYNATVAGLSTTGSNLTLVKVTNGSTGTGTATLTVNPNGAVTPADSTFGGILQDGATAKLALTKAGAQTLTLAGNNTYTGGTQINGGTLALSGNGTLGGGAFSVGGGTLNLGGKSITNAFTLLSSGTVGNGTITNNGGSYDLRSGTVGAALAGTHGLAKTTSGTVTLNAVNTYSGNTTIAAGGTLALGSGASIGNSAFIVNNGVLDVSAVSGFTIGAAQTLTGAGSITGSVAIAGAFAPGNSPGSVSISGGLSLSGTATFEIGGATQGVSFDYVSAGGSITWGGSLALVGYNGYDITAQTGSYDLFNFTGHSGNLASISLASLSFVRGGDVWTATDSNYLYSFSQATGVLDVTASTVPEPSAFAALAGVGALGLAASRRRRRA